MNDDIINLDLKRKERDEINRIVFEFEIKDQKYKEFLQQAKQNTSTLARQIIFSVKDILKRVITSLLIGVLLVLSIWFLLMLTVDDLTGLHFEEVQSFNMVAYLPSTTVIFIWQIADMFRSKSFTCLFHKEAEKNTNDFMLDRKVRQVVRRELEKATT